jgi:hypothetical protein
MGGGAGGGAATGGGATAGGGVAGGGAGVGGGGGEVVIAAKRLAPDVMLVVDRSGSMTLPLDPADAACSACNGTTCPPGCVTRGRHMQQQVTAFATNLADVARLGLVAFPSNASCAGPMVTAVPLPAGDDEAGLRVSAEAIATQLRMLSFSGATPTAAALRFAAADPALTADAGRKHYLVLVSDGPPNCNAANPNSCMMPAACRCTLGMSGCMGALCRAGCLDRQATFDAVTSARGRDVETLVVGVGPEVLGGDVLDVFNGLAQAGGFPLSCPAGGLNECGAGNACLGDRTCARKFSADLATGLARAAGVIRRGAACRYVLGAPVPDAARLEVRVNEQVVPFGADGWQLDDATTVRFVGSVCTLLATPGAALPVTFTLTP